MELKPNQRYRSEAIDPVPMMDMFHCATAFVVSVTDNVVKFYYSDRSPVGFFTGAYHFTPAEFRMKFPIFLEEIEDAINNP